MIVAIKSRYAEVAQPMIGIVYQAIGCIKGTIKMEELAWLANRVARGRMDRREFVGRAGALGVTAVAASTLLSEAGAAAEPKRGGEVTVATEYAGAEETLDPLQVTNATDIQRVYQVYNRLTNLDRDLNVVPNLATEWEASEGATVWTFKLREGVEFHDGRSFSADDVIYSIAQHIKEGSESPAKTLLDPIIDMKADGPHVLVFTLNSGNADFPVLLGHDLHTSIVPEGFVDGDEIVGTGPYRLVEFTPGQESITTKFANYWKSDAGYVDTFITLGIPDNTTRSNALRTGEIDINTEVEPRTAQLLDQDSGINVSSTPSGAFMVWDMMCDRAPTSDLNVRLALKHSVDRQYLVDNLLLGHGKVANDFPVNPGLPSYCHDIPQHTYDPDKAKFYWDKAGIDSIELAVSNAGYASAIDASVILQEQAGAAGVNIVVDRVPDDGYWTHTWMQRPFNISGWNSRPTADLILTLAHQCGGSWNETAWCNERFDELLVMGRTETDPEKRLEIYCEACTLLHDDGGAFIPFFTNYVTGVAKRIQNFHGSSAYSTGAGWPYEEIWIDDSLT